MLGHIVLSKYRHAAHMQGLSLVARVCHDAQCMQSLPCP